MSLKIIRYTILLAFLFSFNLKGFSFYKINSLEEGDAVFKEFKDSIAYTSKYINFHRKYTEADLHLLRDLPQLKLAIYNVRQEDTIFSIAEKSGLSVDTIISVNSFGGEFFLKKGDKIIIPNMKGVIFKFPRRIRLAEISRLYGVSIYILKQINNIRRNTLYENEELFIPSGRLSVSELDVFLQRQFILPVKGPLTSRYGPRPDPFTGRPSYHPGIDIGGPLGAPVKATAKGRVTFAGWKGGYGLLLIIEHDNGYTSYYGHLMKNSITVRAGQIVSSGQLIARVGMTGRTTGPHIHFEIRRYGIIKNPMQVFKLSSMASLY